MSAYRDKPDVEPAKRDWSRWEPYLMRLSAFILLACGLSTGLFLGVVLGSAGILSEIKGTIGMMALCVAGVTVGAYVAGLCDKERK